MDEMDIKWYQNEDYERTDAMEDKKFDLKLISTIAKEDNLFRLIVSSFCPQIYGYHLVKSGLVLALFGGVHKQDLQSKGLSVRANIHVLLFGDHGSNKDLLLKAMHSMAPKAHYICGNISNRNSLITSVKKSGDEKALQRGCLQSKRMAICCFDEFERMDVSQHQIIDQVMEYQTLTYCSANICRHLKANTSIISAVNPLNGCYDWSLNVWQNTRIRKSLLSKFDLIFVLVDSPDEEMDSKISKDMLNSRKLQKSDQNVTQRVSHTMSSQLIDCQLMAKLNVGPDEELDLIPHPLLQHYISFAQKYINPVLNIKANEELIKFYTELEPTLISRSQTRDIESLYRLTEARARLELRTEATVEDVLDVIDIVRHSVGKHFKSPNLVHSMVSNISFRNSKKSQNVKNLLKALKIFCEKNQRKEFTSEEILKICDQFEIPFESKDEIWAAVERLNDQTFILKQNSNYKLND